MDRLPDRLRIALVAPPVETVPPLRYGGTERVVAALADELARRGHDVTLIASGDSRSPGRLIPVTPQAVWRTGYRGDVSAWFQLAVDAAWRHHAEFDIIHSHLEVHGFVLARYCPTPVVTTLHGRLDQAGVPELIDRFRDIPLVAISASQRRWSPEANWVATIHHGLPLASAPFGSRPGDYLAFVGRVAREKGIAEAIELARRTGRRLRMAAKVYDPPEAELFDELIRPAIDANVVEYHGQLTPAERDPLLAGALATLMLGAWPEPFGLVAIESLATGTPVIARRAGALPEIIEHGVDGFLVDDLEEAVLAVRRVAGLDRSLIRRRALARFSVARMTDEYERVYRRVLAARARPPARAAEPAPATIGEHEALPTREREPLRAAEREHLRAAGPEPLVAGERETRVGKGHRWPPGEPIARWPSLDRLDS